jgi:hypothetical protein
MFLVVLPLVNMISAFNEFGLRPWRQSTAGQGQSAPWVIKQDMRVGQNMTSIA